MLIYQSSQPIPFMEYKVMITSYGTRKVPNIPKYDELRGLEDLLNHEVTPVSEKTSLKGFTVKEMHATPMGERIVYTVVFQKE